MERGSDKFRVFHSEDNERLPMLVRMLLCEYYDPSFCGEDIRHSCMILILCELIHCYVQQKL